jgi:mRNA-degrading endonuclease RelE of RelBE toxin-antitoxin system
MENKYRLLFGNFFHERLMILHDEVRGLQLSLSPSEYVCHPKTKLLARIMEACLDIIPSNPNHSNYFLKGKLSRFRRFKRGIQRYRIMFYFSSTHGVILYLYLNDESHLMKEGSKSDPYVEFADLLHKGIISSDPTNPTVKQWFRKNGLSNL